MYNNRAGRVGHGNARSGLDNFPFEAAQPSAWSRSIADALGIVPVEHAQGRRLGALVARADGRAVEGTRGQIDDVVCRVSHRRHERVRTGGDDVVLVCLARRQEDPVSQSRSARAAGASTHCLEWATVLSRTAFVPKAQAYMTAAWPGSAQSMRQSRTQSALILDCH